MKYEKYLQYFMNTKFLSLLVKLAFIEMGFFFCLQSPLPIIYLNEIINNTT